MILDLFKLDGKVAVVTGANTGLGQGMAIALAQAGAKVVLVGRRNCDETQAKIDEFGGQSAQVLADLSLTESVDNAGIIKRCDAIDVPKQDWDSVINVNLNMVFLLCQAFAKQYVKQGDGGKIINVCSMLSFQGGIRVPAYTASKSAVMGLTKALANEWASKGIQVNAIAPGYMATNNTSQLRSDADRSEAILDRIPAGRWGTPEDMQGAAVFLASKASDYVNGYTVAVDGGWLAR